jgi:uncharacterized membrane protein YjgN (DUF898 family)
MRRFGERPFVGGLTGGIMETSATQNVVYPAQPLRFTGSGAEYFGIWIVNLLLTLLTLGIYSAWAKVRRLQYFDRHTELAGASFDFHGRPLAILIGRLIALILLLLYSYGTRHPSALTLAIVLVIGLAMPWLLRNSLRFRLYNTSWRGLRFSFRGSLGGAYRVFLLNFVLTVLTLYLLAPFFHHRLKRYQHDNSWFGRSAFSFHASAGSFYGLYLVLAGAMIVAGIGVVMTAGGALSALAHIKPGDRPDPQMISALFRILFGVFIFLSLVIGPWFQTRLANLIWNNTRIGNHRIECRQSALRLMWIMLSNFVLMAVTLGLFYPWAAVRLARFRVESVSLLPASNLQEFEAAPVDAIGAVGEETASVFDFDISL